MPDRKNEKQLFLAGGGGKFDSVKIDERFANALDKKTPLAYIPNAICKKPYSECLNWLRDVFCPFGVVEIEMWSDLKKAATADMSFISGLYIGGGDTTKLLFEIYDAGFDKQLREICERGLPIYGGSAGAIILGQTILTAPEAKGFLETKAKGLGLVDGFSIYCHYDGRKDLKSLSKSLGTKIIAIPEKSGVSLTDKSFEVVGYESVTIFSSDNVLNLQIGRIYQIGELYKILDIVKRELKAQED